MGDRGQKRKLSEEQARESLSVSSAALPLGGVPVRTLLSNALVPSTPGYERKDVLLAEGKIAKISAAKSEPESTAEVFVDCSEKLLLPGFVNAHTHSTEHWTRGLIKPLPLELWVAQLYRHEPRGDEGWYGKESHHRTPAEALGVSALLCGAESMLSGCTAIMDHIAIRHLDDLDAIVRAYKALGMRAFVAPMLGDDAVLWENFIPLVPDGAARNAKCSCCGGLGKNGSFRAQPAAPDSAKTKKMLQLWEEAVKRFHDPENGIEIVIGPVTPYSASTELLRGAVELRKKYGLCGHTHLLETRGQAMQARQWFPSGSAVQHLLDVGFLQLPGTSCAHTIWLEDYELAMMAKFGATCVHNPLSNLILGSGVMPVKKALDAGVSVSVGCDGSCSSNGQDLLEALKLATTVACVTTPEYRDWPTAKQTALSLAARNGYKGVGMESGGKLEEGCVADVTLWDLTSLALLPRTDPISSLVLGSRTQAPGAGSTLHSSWVRGIRVVAEGSLCGLDLLRLREMLASGQDYKSPDTTDPATDPFTKGLEVEYRAVFGLDGQDRLVPVPENVAKYRPNCVLYDATIR